MKAFAFRLFLLLLGSVLAASNIESNHFRKVDKFAMSQYLSGIADVKELARFISGKYAKETDRLRAAYTWTIHNIEYDLTRIGYPISYRGDSAVGSTLKNRKAICSGYADLFIKLCYYMDISAYYIAGYTKKDGAVQDIAHAWVAVRLTNGKWKLFDPTWDSGYSFNGFWIKRRTYNYFMAEPADFIKTHFPFDPMWQLLYQPISSTVFTDTNEKYADGQIFNYSDTIARHQIRTESRMCSDIMRRMEWCGISTLSARQYYEATREHFAYMQKIECDNAKANWFYSLSKVEQCLEDARNMFLQLEDLKHSYEERGISIKQLIFSSDELIKFIDKTQKTLFALSTEEYAEPGKTEPLLMGVEALLQKAITQNSEITRITKKLVGNDNM